MNPSIEHSTEGHAVPRFSIYSEPGVIVESLKKCFLKTITLDLNNLLAVIKGDDGYTYTVVYDTRFPAGQRKAICKVSFQHHSYGRFAIVRLEKNRRM